MFSMGRLFSAVTGNFLASLPGSSAPFTLRVATFLYNFTLPAMHSVQMEAAASVFNTEPCCKWSLGDDRGLCK